MTRAYLRHMRITFSTTPLSSACLAGLAKLSKKQINGVQREAEVWVAVLPFQPRSRTPTPLGFFLSVPFRSSFA